MSFGSQCDEVGVLGSNTQGLAVPPATVPVRCIENMEKRSTGSIENTREEIVKEF